MENTDLNLILGDFNVHKVNGHTVPKLVIKTFKACNFEIKEESKYKTIITKYSLSLSEIRIN